MREINKTNMEIGKFQNAGIAKDKVEKAEPQFCGETEELNVNDFSNPTEILGRSQVNKSDNLASDVKFLSEHPEVAESSDKLFDIAFKGLQAAGDPDAYEKACSIVTSQDAKDLLSR